MAKRKNWFCNTHNITTIDDTSVLAQHHMPMIFRADSRFAPSQWGTALLCNDVSHWLGANLDSALNFRISLPLWKWWLFKFKFQARFREYNQIFQNIWFRIAAIIAARIIHFRLCLFHIWNILYGGEFFNIWLEKTKTTQIPHSSRNRYYPINFKRSVFNWRDDIAIIIFDLFFWSKNTVTNILSRIMDRTKRDRQINMLYQWFCARLQYLQCVNNGDTAVLH